VSNLFVIEHGRRRILHFNVTYYPTSARVVQQLRESFPFDTAVLATPLIRLRDQQVARTYRLLPSYLWAAHKGP